MVPVDVALLKTTDNGAAPDVLLAEKFATGGVGGAGGGAGGLGETTM